MKLRTDGKSIDIDGDYTETLARLDADKNAVGVFGLSFYQNNTDKLRVATMGGVVPSTESIASGEYPVSRPLFFYVKNAHLDVIPGLKEYVEFFVSDDMAGWCAHGMGISPLRSVRPPQHVGNKADFRAAAAEYIVETVRGSEASTAKSAVRRTLNLDSVYRDHYVPALQAMGIDAWPS